MSEKKSSYVVVRKAEINETLAIPPSPGKKSLEPFKSFAKERGLPFEILEDSQVLDNEAEVHTHESDLWLCLEGSITFICGGELVDPWVKKNSDGSENPRQLKAKVIRDGDEVVLQAGDWLWVPAGVPHQHRCANTARLVIAKIPIV